MRTPLAAIRASAESLRRNLETLFLLFDDPAFTLDAARDAAALVRAALARREAPPPVTGLAASKEIEETDHALRREGVVDGADALAAVIVRGGWRAHAGSIAALARGHGAAALLPILDAAGRLRVNLRSLDASAERLEPLVAALRSGLGGAPTAPAAAFPVRECLESALATLSHKVPDGVEVEIRCPGGLVLNGVRLQIEQVVANLVDNAVAALEGRAGRVVVAAEGDAGAVVVRVEDDGPGLPPDGRSRLFTPFATTKPEGKGTGLGLFVCRRIVEGHGGTLSFDSRPGATRFEARFPSGRR